ncbi:NAD(P)/FAD-dependent oxidoreductase [Curtobacterium ammoniigenes]|uniref:NAD(P)/FAD-dependent oxidoreductase n=1 Tax=Curtobacterium ammoniigenes TaxID=395387 RepID=UPI001FDECF06|nr:NAD(P)/FAD-dependent oxidoreductase [Curtobacterium ammoniigenes]
MMDAYHPSPAGDAVSVDVAVVGAGPAGLSAALNLVRATRTVILIDANRPRNAATLRSHGFVTRDGISPLELRKLGWAEVDGYPEATAVRASVTSIVPTTGGWAIAASGRDGELAATARSVILASGLRETFPAIPSLRAYYGTSVHSCVECDGYEKAGLPIALIGETDDLYDRAVHLHAWSTDLIVFTNGVARLTQGERARLAELGVEMCDEPIADLEGDRSGLTGVRLQSGRVIGRSAGFVRPRWRAELAFLDADTQAQLRRAPGEGFLEVDRAGRTGIAGLYAVGDITEPGPEQLIVAAGHGAITAAAVHRDLIGSPNGMGTSTGAGTRAGVVTSAEGMLYSK